MTKAEIIKAICEKPDYRFTHDEMMRMTKKELLEYYPEYSETETSEDLEKAAEELADKHGFIKKSATKAKYTHLMVRDIFIEAIIAGAEWQKEQIVGIIENRIAEILGDAQPAPVLRYELTEIIKRIKEDEK